MMALSNDEILDAIANMTVQQAADLVKAMEEKFGVSAAAPVAVAAAGPAAAAEEQTEFTVTLDSVDAAKKIADYEKNEVNKKDVAYTATAVVTLPTDVEVNGDFMGWKSSLT
ncbi:MAG: hypothetical protein IJJ66_03730, partial [Treponema sp.]|nr:hypothetical protein [Treponema sp.]